MVDVAEVLESLVLPSNAFGNGLGCRWWRAAQSGADIWQTTNVVVVGWLLQRLQRFFQTRQLAYTAACLPAPIDTRPVPVERA